MVGGNKFHVLCNHTLSGAIWPWRVGEVFHAAVYIYGAAFWVTSQRSTAKFTEAWNRGAAFELKVVRVTAFTVFHVTIAAARGPADILGF